MHRKLMRVVCAKENSESTQKAAIAMHMPCGRFHRTPRSLINVLGRFACLSGVNGRSINGKRKLQAVQRCWLCIARNPIKSKSSYTSKDQRAMQIFDPARNELLRFCGRRRPQASKQIETDFQATFAWIE